jgi:hypothetical protein
MAMTHKTTKPLKSGDRTREGKAMPAKKVEHHPKALICKHGPAAVIDICMLRLDEKADIEQVPTLADGLKRCLEGGVDVLFVNLFSYTARELTALSAFRSMMPDQPVVAVAGADMQATFMGSDLVDEVFVVIDESKTSQPRAQLQGP